MYRLSPDLCPQRSNAGVRGDEATGEPPGIYPRSVRPEARPQSKMCSAWTTPRHISRERLKGLLQEAYKEYDRLICAMDHMVEYRKETISQLRSVAHQLDERRRDVNIAKAVGGTVGAAGAAATVAGIVLSPFTLGGSLLLMVPGVVALGSGTTTAVGADLTGSILDKMDLEKAQRAVNRDRKQCEWVRNLWKGFEKYCKKIIDVIDLADPSEGTDITSLKTWTKTIIRRGKQVTSLVGAAFAQITSYISSTQMGKELIGKIGGEKLLQLFREVVEKIGAFMPAPIVEKSGLLFTNMLRVLAPILIAGVGLFDLGIVVTSLIDLHKGSVSTVADDLRSKARELNTELDEWMSAFGEVPSK